MSSLVICLTILCSIGWLYARPLDVGSDDVKRILFKAFELYKQMDGMNEEESMSFLDSIKSVPMGNYWIESEPEGDTNEPDEITEIDTTKTLLKFGWQIAKMLFNKLMQMFS